MCRTKVQGGRRCHKHTNEAYKDKGVVVQELIDETNEVSAEIAHFEQVGDTEMVVKSEKKLAVVVERLDREQKLMEDLRRRRDATPTGRDILRKQLRNKNLTMAERRKVEDTLALAENDFAEEKARRELQFLKQESLRDVLAKQGVSQENINALVQMGTKGKVTPHIRSYNSYAASLANSEDKLDAENSMHDEKTNAIFAAGYSSKEEGRRLTAEDARHEKVVRKLKRQIAEQQLAVDATRKPTLVKRSGETQEEFEVRQANEPPRGREMFVGRAQRDLNRMLRDRDEALEAASMTFNPEEKKALLAKANSLTNRHARGYVKFRLRLAELDRFHEAGMSARRHHKKLMEQIRLFSKAAGGNPDEAVAAWQKPEKPHHPDVDPMERSVSVSVHVTDSEFKHLKKAHVDSGSKEEFGQWVSSRARRNPMVLVESADVIGAQKGFKPISSGKAGRNPTNQMENLAVETENRSKVLRISMTLQDKETIKKRASAFHDATSSYVSKLIRDKNPVMVQNDRSAKHRAIKIEKCSELIDSLRG